MKEIHNELKKLYQELGSITALMDRCSLNLENEKKELIEKINILEKAMEILLGF